MRPIERNRRHAQIRCTTGLALFLGTLLLASTARLAAEETGSDPLGSAREAFQRAEYEAVIRGTQDILMSRPEDAAASVLLGRALTRLGRVDEAEAILRGVIEREPGGFDAYVAIAEVYRKAARWTELEGLIDETVPLGPRVSGPTALAVLDQLSIAGRLEPAAGIARRMLEEDDDPVRRAGWAVVDSVGRISPQETLAAFAGFLETSPPQDWIPAFSDSVFHRLPEGGRRESVPRSKRQREAPPRDDGITPPWLTVRVAPDYSDRLRRKGIRGKVALEALITKEGRAIRIFPQSTDHPVLSVLAINAVRQWRFDPAKDGSGTPTELHYTIRVEFR